jgi:hypothetical protein
MKICKQNFRMTIFYKKYLSDLWFRNGDVLTLFLLVSVHDLCWNFIFSVTSPMSTLGINFMFWKELWTFWQRKTHRAGEWPYWILVLPLDGQYDGPNLHITLFKGYPIWWSKSVFNVMDVSGRSTGWTIGASKFHNKPTVLFDGPRW